MRTPRPIVHLDDMSLAGHRLGGLLLRVAVLVAAVLFALAELVAPARAAALPDAGTLASLTASALVVLAGAIALIGVLVVGRERMRRRMAAQERAIAGLTQRLVVEDRLAAGTAAPERAEPTPTTDDLAYAMLADSRERAESASRAKSRFLAIVSHEVRTPLNGILGMTDLLADTQLTPEQRSYVGAVKSSGDALLALIEEILDFSKIEAGRLDLDEVPFDPARLVLDVVELLAPRAQAKGIELVADIDDDMPLRLLGDPARLRQVLLNLAGNAVKFTESGGVTVKAAREADGRIAVRVEDTGPGIAPEDRARIFAEFEQADTSSARKHGGAGLGLAISERIVRRMGGTLGLESDLGRGSAFAFSVPIPALAEADLSVWPDLAGTAVLVVTASPVLGPVLARRLGGWGASVALAADLAVTRALLPERHWDAVFVDRGLGADRAMTIGREAIGHAGRRIALIAPAERVELPGLQASGFDSYLVKPVRPQSLAERLLPSLPTLATPALVPDAGPANMPAADTPAAGLSVLVAEDNEINAFLARAMLAKLGHRPWLVGDGAAAVTAVEEAHASGAPFDLVLMDMQLPEIDGLEATRRIRALGEAGELPIVALTANAYAEDRAAALEAGMDGFLSKPLDRERLEAAIATAARARGDGASVAA